MYLEYTIILKATYVHTILQTSSYINNHKLKHNNTLVLDIR